LVLFHELKKSSIDKQFLQKQTLNLKTRRDCKIPTQKLILYYSKLELYCSLNISDLM